MNNINPFSLILWLHLRMQPDFNCLIDASIASIDATQDEIDRAFVSQPRCERLRVDHKWITRKEWDDGKKVQVVKVEVI